MNQAWRLVAEIGVAVEVCNQFADTHVCQAPSLEVKARRVVLSATLQPPPHPKKKKKKQKRFTIAMLRSAQPVAVTRSTSFSFCLQAKQVRTSSNAAPAAPGAPALARSIARNGPQMQLQTDGSGVSLELSALSA